MIDEEEKTSCYLYVEEPAFKFTKRLPQQMEGDEGLTAEIECEIEDRDAEVDWYFEGKKIVPEDDPQKYDLVVNDTKRKLIIKKCDPNLDRGRIECKCGVVTTGTEFFVRPALKVVKGLKVNFYLIYLSIYIIKTVVTPFCLIECLIFLYIAYQTAMFDSLF